MKKLFRISAAIVAALVSLAACQKANEVENQAPKLTHSVKFTTDLSTKTSYVIEETEVKYKWENEDLNRLHVYEDGVEGTIDVEGSAIDKNYVMLTVNFEGSGEGVHTYTANLNEGIVKSNQVADGKYDSDSDVLVAKPVSSDEIVEDYYTFRFRRPVAITELKLKNLKAEEKVSKVTIVSDAVHPLVGTYTQSETDAADGTWDEKSNKIVVTFGTEQDGETPKTKTVESDGSLIVPIVSMPVEGASVKVLVETESGLKYRKVTSPALTLVENNVMVQGIGLTQITEAEHAEDGWYLVTDANELFDGDEIRIACPEKGMIAGEFAVVSEETKEYLTANTATFTPDTFEKLTGVDSENRPNTFTLAENYGSFALVNSNGKLGTTGAKKMSYDDGLTVYGGVTEWTIAIADKLATISTGDDYGRILYNHNSGNNSRFLNYAFSTSTTTSMLLPHLYKKYGDAQDPIIKTKRTASFNPATATVTINADDNVFPELSFDPADATDGEQSWTSSNTEVATVDNEGNVTLLKDGTTTITVQIAESETYQPCNASYELTVKPAEVQGVDYLDLAFTNVTSTSYTDWENTCTGSGNTYAGNSTKFKSDDKNNSDGIDAIQLRTTNSNSGIVVTNSASNQVARKITVDWNSGTASGRTIDIYGKSSAYTAASDLYPNVTQGTKLGSIVNGTSTELTITGDYEYIGIRSNSSALYLNWIKIQWEDAKPEYEACFKDAGGTVVTEVNATVGEVFTAPTLYKGATPSFADAYESSNPDVAEVSNTGVVTLHKKGDAIITATLNGDETHRKTEVPYTIHVANVLSSIEITTEPTKKSYYVGDEADYSGIAVTANYNDNTSAEIAADKLNFSGFDSSEAVAEQAITVSYTENDVTKTASYNVEIKAATTLYDIDVTAAADANGNSVTVEGSKEKAEEGDEITLNVNLATGYKLTSLKINEAEHSADVVEGKYTFSMPAEAVTVTASFDNHYNVVLGSATNGSFTVNGESTSPVSIVYGTTVNLVATPATGYVFKTWTVEGATVASATAATTTFTMPAGNVTVGATFAIELPKTTVEFSSLGYSTWGKDAAFSGETNNEVTQTKNHVTFTYTRNTGSCYANTTSIRFYKDNNLTFSVPTGCQIVSIEWGGSNWKTDVTTNKETCNCTLSGLSWSGEATSVTFSRPSSATNYVTLSSVTVKYTGTPEGGDTPTKLSIPAGLTWTEGNKTLSWTNTNTSNGMYGTDYKYQYRIGSDGSWTNATSPTTAVLTITETKTVYVKAVALNTTDYSDSDETSGTSCTISGGGQGGGTAKYVKVTSSADLTDGTYLIVYEKSSTEARIFNGLDAANDYVEATITNSEIASSNSVDAVTVTISAMTGGYSIKIDDGDKKGNYISGKSNSNSIQYGKTEIANEITFSSGLATILSNSTSLRYNSMSGNDRFRYYKTTTTGNNYIYPALYKKVN